MVAEYSDAMLDVPHLAAVINQDLSTGRKPLRVVATPDLMNRKYVVDRARTGRARRRDQPTTLAHTLVNSMTAGPLSVVLKFKGRYVSKSLTALDWFSFRR